MNPARQDLRTRRSQIAKVALLTAVAALTVVLLSWLGHQFSSRDQSRRPSAQSAPPNKSVGVPAEADGIRGRPVDPATASYWCAQGEDCRALEARARESQPVARLVLENFEANKDLLGWATGMITEDDDASQALLECRLAHEPRQTDNCMVKQSFVIRRTGPTSGRTVFIESELDNISTGACRAYAACVRGAWMGRQASLPPGEDALFTVSGELHHNEAFVQGEAYIGTYTRILEGLQNKWSKRKDYFESNMDSLSETQVAGFRQSLLHEELRMQDATKVLEQLR